MKVNAAFFPTKVKALEEFGFEGQVLVQALWRIPNQSNRYLWFANSGEYRGLGENYGGLNTLSDDGLKFTDRRDHREAGANSYGNHASKDVERILFLRTTRFGQETFKFAGVFKPDLERSILNVSAWKRVSDECSVPNGSWPQSETLT